MQRDHLADVFFGFDPGPHPDSLFPRSSEGDYFLTGNGYPCRQPGFQAGQGLLTGDPDSLFVAQLLLLDPDLAVGTDDKFDGRGEIPPGR
ncbi:hypothetical protein MOCA_17760 [Moorella thermoacetica]|nr:hypothetical protein MOCA_17760 [Moorella thermoacetica]TYL15217.1 hypothetical protein MOCE_17820 [Moorella thermoacetica]